MKKIISIIVSIVIVSSLAVVAQARLVGDIDKNGIVTSADALQVLTYAVGSSKEIDTNIADVNSDGNVNSSDALIILQICVGSYSGDLEVNDLETNYKITKIDPILQSGKFTLKTNVVSDGKTIPATIEVNGNNMAVTMTISAMKTRILILGNKTYMIFPDLFVYGELKDYDLDIDLGATKVSSTYKGSEYVTRDGKKYVCEHYINDNGSKSDYYFLNGEWKMMESTDTDGKVSSQEITSFSSSVNASSFSLSSYKEIDLSSIIK